MVVKRDREEQCGNKKENQDLLIGGADHEQPDKTDNQDDKLRSDHIRQNCADKEALFALEKRAAVWTVMPDLKRAVKD